MEVLPIELKKTTIKETYLLANFLLEPVLNLLRQDAMIVLINPKTATIHLPQDFIIKMNVNGLVMYCMSCQQTKRNALLRLQENPQDNQQHNPQVNQQHNPQVNQRANQLDNPQDNLRDSPQDNLRDSPQ
jgi:hypothetical protein